MSGGDINVQWEMKIALTKANNSESTSINSELLAPSVVNVASSDAITITSNRGVSTGGDVTVSSALGGLSMAKMAQMAQRVGDSSSMAQTLGGLSMAQMAQRVGDSSSMAQMAQMAQRVGDSSSSSSGSDDSSSSSSGDSSPSTSLKNARIENEKALGNNKQLSTGDLYDEMSPEEGNGNSEFLQIKLGQNDVEDVEVVGETRGGKSHLIRYMQNDEAVLARTLGIDLGTPVLVNPKEEYEDPPVIGEKGGGNSQFIDRFQATSTGDPYIQPLIGNVYKLPTDEKIYRMIDAPLPDGKKLVVNAQMWMPNTKEAKFLNDRCVAFCALRGFKVPKRVRLIHTGMSFTRLVFAHFDEQWAVVDLVTLKVLQQSDNCPALSEPCRESKGNIEGLTDQHGIIVRTLTFRDDIKVHFARFANPQVLTGVQLTIPNTLAKDTLAGCLVRSTAPESLQLETLDHLDTLTAEAYVEQHFETDEKEVFLTFKNKQLVNRVIKSW